MECAVFRPCETFPAHWNAALPVACVRVTVHVSELPNLGSLVSPMGSVSSRHLGIGLNGGFLFGPPADRNTKGQRHVECGNTTNAGKPKSPAPLQRSHARRPHPPPPCPATSYQLPATDFTAPLVPWCPGGEFFSAPLPIRHSCTFAFIRGLPRTPPPQNEIPKFAAFSQSAKINPQSTIRNPQSADSPLPAEDHMRPCYYKSKQLTGTKADFKEDAKIHLLTEAQFNEFKALVLAGATTSAAHEWLMAHGVDLSAGRLCETLGKIRLERDDFGGSQERSNGPAGGTRSNRQRSAHGTRSCRADFPDRNHPSRRVIPPLVEAPAGRGQPAK